MRQQLLDARATIVAQLDAMDFRTVATSAQGGPPDYRGLTAQLQEELREIDALLGEDAPAAPYIPWGGRR
ncbi:MAG TPA: hypothetical protein VGC56_01295 [Allosphingosinicella sp.]|jgi:hypothetical protein